MVEFPTRRASIVLAHGNLFSKAAACELYGVASGTYDGWRNKLKTNSELKRLYSIELDKLAEEWQGESIRTLKKGLNTIETAFINHPFNRTPKSVKDTQAWAKAVGSMSLAIKCIGDLTIANTVLLEEDDDDDED